MGPYEIDDSGNIVGFEPFFPSKFGHQDSTRYSKYKRAKIGQKRQN
jgi:hypothetical protein